MVQAHLLKTYAGTTKAEGRLQSTGGWASWKMSEKTRTCHALGVLQWEKLCIYTYSVVDTASVLTILRESRLAIVTDTTFSSTVSNLFTTPSVSNCRSFNFFNLKFYHLFYLKNCAKYHFFCYGLLYQYKILKNNLNLIIFARIFLNKTSDQI